MKNFWLRMNMRWSGEELSHWGSFQKTVYLLWPLLIYFIVHDAAEILLWAGAGAVFAGKEATAGFLAQNYATVRGVINGLAIVFGVASIWQAVKRELAGGEGEGGKSGGNIHGEKAGAKDGMDSGSGLTACVTRYCVVAAIAFLSAMGFNLLMNLLGLTGISGSYKETSQAQYGVNFIVGLFLYGAVSPIAEEAVFRGVIYNRMKRCFNYPVALCVSALLFGCYHGNAVQAVYGTILGILIAWCYELCGSFFVPVLFHGVANVSMYVMTSYGGLENMSQPVSVGVTAACLLGAAGFLLYLQRNEENNGKLQ